MMANETLQQWKDGIYSLKSLPNNVYLVSGENAKLQEFINGQESSFHEGSWKFGEFGNTHVELEKVTGKKISDIEITFRGGKWQVHGVVSNEGKTIIVWDGKTNQLDHYEWMSEKDYQIFKDIGDSWDAPASHYKTEPDNVGKLIWITGAPGTGKSTAAQMLSKMFGYVYYEGDSFIQMVNPYINPNADEPTNAVELQKRLKGIPQDVVDAITKGNEAFNAMRRGQNYKFEDVIRRFDAQCANIANERRRIGGDWVIASGIYDKELRNRVVKNLGPDIVIVGLEIDREEQRRRLEKRHGDNGGYHWWRNFDHWVYNLFKPIEATENNAIKIDVSGNTSREEIARDIEKRICEHTKHENYNK